MQPPEPVSNPDDFDEVLKDLARPPAVGAGLAADMAQRSTHPLDDALGQVLREAAPLPEPRPGDVLEGRYQITGILGRGGMGVVLEAEQIRTKKIVALKWMNATSGGERSPALVARFLREARAVANIQHPNVVDLYDVGGSDGVPYLVLERLRGESLRSRISRGPMPWSEAEPIIRGVLSGVAAVHRAGIVHRDLKPDNIFLCTEGQTLTPKVLDFGVAAMRSSSQDGLQSLTHTGAVVGTPAYMALEQLTGGDVDARADIYALGALLYEMLTGRLPFEARSTPELAVLLATREPVPPSKLLPKLDRALEEAILRALERKPEARFEDVAAFSRALSKSVGSPRGLRAAVKYALVLTITAVTGAAWAWTYQRTSTESARAIVADQKRHTVEPVTPDVPPLRSAVYNGDLGVPEGSQIKSEPQVLVEDKTAHPSPRTTSAPTIARPTKQKRLPTQENGALRVLRREPVPVDPQRGVEQSRDATTIRVDDF